MAFRSRMPGLPILIGCCVGFERFDDAFLCYEFVSNDQVKGFVTVKVEIKPVKLPTALF